MYSFAAWFVFILFASSMAVLSVYGCHLYVLVYLFRRKRRHAARRQQDSIDLFARTPRADWPAVTTQLPIYNEKDVARRLIEAVAAMDYPKDKHEIQVLDDSTDDCVVVVDQVVARLRASGFDIQVVRRPSREGYKAGALAYGVARCRGEFIAMFDADFVPPTDFLLKSVPIALSEENLACVQGRWTHLNEHETLLTRAQALGLDVHFAIEQGARAWNNLFMNFNGTAGLWRRKAIEDPKVGGWSGDTLVEDMDLSYRAQLAGWRMDYCFDLECPAELPNTIQALKSQQRRWATGAVQVGVKLLPTIWRPSSRTSFGQKLEAAFHLSNHFTSVFVLLVALVAWPVFVYIAYGHPLLTGWLPIIWTAIICATILPLAVYGYARWTVGGGFSGFRTIPIMLAVGLGLSVNNGLAALRGL